MDITIKGVPEGAEESVKRMSRVAVKRFKEKALVKPEADMEEFDSANSINAKV